MVKYRHMITAMMSVTSQSKHPYITLSTKCMVHPKYVQENPHKMLLLLLLYTTIDCIVASDAFLTTMMRLANGVDCRRKRSVCLPQL